MNYQEFFEWDLKKWFGYSDEKEVKN